MIVNNLRTRSTQKGGRQRGAVLVEFAASIIVLVLLLLVIMEFGWLVKNNSMVQNATREGARVASIGRSKTEIENRIRASIQPSVSDVVITLKNSPNTTTAFTAFPADKPAVGTQPATNGVPAGDMIEVVVTAKHKPLTGTKLLTLGDKVTSRVVMIRESGP
ncbi:MAG TPA: TadE/TadG family type IV pilus assembly protein [Abditibacteriaceae bacterium]|jgi:Flp pilus assembly protein TadG